ncbi:MAG TPA: PTS sugar transporter subunit IIC, partial [Gemmatimonadaceae bacterium]|nr:PTS sugar transporter subunit IIC [Gemmatimonadaceae bacterium]
MLVLIGTLCSLDTVSVGQTMMSRPLVSATLAGAALGQAEQGVVVGAVMELFALETMPFGASRYPEWGAAGVVASATYVFGGVRTPGSLAVAVIGGLAAAGFGSITMVWHRGFVARSAAALREPLAAGSADAVARLHAAGIASDLFRGAAVTAIGLGLSVLLATTVLTHWHIGYGASLAWPIIAAGAVGMSAVVRTV